MVNTKLYPLQYDGIYLENYDFHMWWGEHTPQNVIRIYYVLFMLFINKYKS